MRYDKRVQMASVARGSLLGNIPLIPVKGLQDSEEVSFVQEISSCGYPSGFGLFQDWDGCGTFSMKMREKPPTTKVTYKPRSAVAYLVFVRTFFL